MKTVKASGFLYQIDESQLEDQLSDIIKTHRAYLIDCKLNLLSMYIEYRFGRKLSFNQLQHAKRSLKGFKNTPVKLGAYAAIVQQVKRYAYFDLPNTPFYQEIDARLSEVLNQTEISFGPTAIAA